MKGNSVGNDLYKCTKVLFPFHSILEKYLKDVHYDFFGPAEFLSKKFNYFKIFKRRM